MSNTKILCVDDERKVLSAIQRQHGDDFDITTAIGPFEALEVIEDEGPFAVVLSDMRMPEMNGVELLSRVRERSPDTVRMVLTGYADLKTTIEAVNKGHIFRFLSKPCAEEDLISAFNAALRQFELIEAEKELVEGTLQGSVKVLSEVLALVRPLAFGQSNRVREIVDGILKRIEVENAWQLQIAAMLSSLGCITLPNDVLEKKIEGESVSHEENQLYGHHPEIGGDLIRSIPRLEYVADIIACQNAPLTSDRFGEKNIPLESRILQIAVAFDSSERKTESSLHALNDIKQSFSALPTIFEALTQYVKEERHVELAELEIEHIREGMVLAEDVRDKAGMLLISKGQRVSGSAKKLLNNFAKSGSVKPVIKVVVAREVAETLIH